jgi:hypothetical protein
MCYWSVDGKFLGFIIHEHGIEIDPDRIKSIQNVRDLIYKLDIQKFGKVNYLRKFISNLVGKIDAFCPILWLKNDVEFTWGQKQNNREHSILLENICLRLQY